MTRSEVHHWNSFIIHFLKIYQLWLRLKDNSTYILVERNTVLTVIPNSKYTELEKE